MSKPIPDAMTPYSARSEAAYQELITVIRTAPFVVTGHQLDRLFEEFWAARKADWQAYYEQMYPHAPIIRIGTESTRGTYVYTNRVTTDGKPIL
jgi:hypothetical protein